MVFTPPVALATYCARSCTRGWPAAAVAAVTPAPAPAGRALPRPPGGQPPRAAFSGPSPPCAPPPFSAVPIPVNRVATAPPPIGADAVAGGPRGLRGGLSRATRPPTPRSAAIGAPG